MAVEEPSKATAKTPEVAAKTRISQALLRRFLAKKRTSARRTGTRRSHLKLELARKVNATSPVKVYTTSRESAKTEKVP